MPFTLLTNLSHTPYLPLFYAACLTRFLPMTSLMIHAPFMLFVLIVLSFNLSSFVLVRHIVTGNHRTGIYTVATIPVILQT